MDETFWSEINRVIPKNSLVVYEAEKPDFKDDKIIELSAKFNVKGRVKSEKNTAVIQQKNKVLSFYKNTGTILYGDFSKLHRPEYKPKLPELDEARKIAEEYLKENKWKPENAIFDDISTNSFEKIEGKKREKRSNWDNNISVNFRYALDQLKTYGPGAKIEVNIGNEGSIIGLFKATPSYYKHAEYPTHTQKDMEEILRWKLGIPLEGLKIDDAKLVYHAESCVEWRRFLQPTYVFDMVYDIFTNRKEKITTSFEMHPIPATTFSPVVAIKAPSNMMEIKFGEPLILSYVVKGGHPPYKTRWDSNIDGHLSDEHELVAKKLSIAHKEGRITSHTIKLTVTDRLGMQDTHKILVKVRPPKGRKLTTKPKDLADPYVGVEWCNIYHGTQPDISGTDDSALGFNDIIDGLSSWSSRFDWGNDAAWEQDFKHATAPGGGTDSNWADNVHFAFFAGHGSSGNFHFGSAVDDNVMRAADAQWGDGLLNWIVLHACQTMRANFEWDVWCDAFNGLHQMFGFHSNTQGSTPPLGTRFALWMSLHFPPFWYAVDMQTAWGIACKECFDSSREYSVIYAGQSGTDTHNDHLPGYGHVSSDPISPYFWAYYKSKC